MARSNLWNASIQLSQQLLWRNCTTTSTPIDISRSLRGVLSPIFLSTIRHPHNHCFIHRLPPEIIGEIFWHYVFDDSPRILPASSRISARPNARTSALTLCHVCSSWRALGFSMSGLWSSLCVIWPKENYAHLVRLWLERSGSRLLSLSLHQDPSRVNDTPAMREVLALCIPHAHRWQDITLDLNDDVQNMFAPLQVGDMQRLESFDVGLRDWDKRQTSQLFGALNSSSSLRSVAWTRSCGHDVPAHVPWGQLTGITLHHVPTSDNLFDILSECRQVEVLHVGSIGFTSPLQHLTVTLPALRVLKLYFIDNLRSILDRLILPAMTTIELPQGFAGPAHLGWSSFFHLVQRSHCCVKKLVYGGDDLDENEFVVAITSPSLNTLADLTLILPITDKTLNALTWCEADGGCLSLPHLERFFLRDCRTSDGILSTFVHSRLASRSKLKIVKARLQGLSYPQDLQLAQNLQHSGVNIIVKDRNFGIIAGST